MIKIENHLGVINISNDYLNNLVGYAVTNCFGVSGMSTGGTSQEMKSLFSKPDRLDKGVLVKNVNGNLVIDIHIIVVYGVNIAEIVKSIVHKVKYVVEDLTGFVVDKVNVFVDGMKSE